MRQLAGALRVAGCAATVRLLLLPARAPLAGAQVHQCHEKCRVCHLFDYSKEWHCLECNEGYDLWVDGCFAPCPPGQYRYGYHCQDCTKNCMKCAGGLEHECMKCAPGYRLDFRSMCVKDCQKGMYSVLDGTSCAECDPYCRTCIAGASISCTSCYAGYTLRVLEPNTKTGECMQNCDKGFFRDAPSDRRCIQCSRYCADCVSLEQCFECEPGASLYRGVCYPVPNTAVKEGIDFNTYLESGAGLEWDPAMAPDWELLMTARRLSGGPLAAGAA